MFIFKEISKIEGKELWAFKAYDAVTDEFVGEFEAIAPNHIAMTEAVNAALNQPE